MQRARWDCTGVGSIDPRSDNALNGLGQSQIRRQPVEVESTHIIGDENVPPM